MQMRTSRRLIASQLTPDMENKLGFLMSKVVLWQCFVNFFLKLLHNDHCLLANCVFDITLLIFCTLGQIWTAKEVSGLVSETVFIHPRESVPTLWSDTLHMCCDTSLKRDSVLWYHTTLGSYWLAVNNLYSMYCLSSRFSLFYISRVRFRFWLHLSWSRNRTV